MRTLNNIFVTSLWVHVLLLTVMAILLVVSEEEDSFQKGRVYHQKLIGTIGQYAIVAVVASSMGVVITWALS